MHYTVSFPGGQVSYIFQQQADIKGTLCPDGNCIIITDSNIARLHETTFKGIPVISIPAGEEHKTHTTVAAIIENLIELQAHRKTCLIGVGGGVVTDITGFVAATYMRGTP